MSEEQDAVATLDGSFKLLHGDVGVLFDRMRVLESTVADLGQIVEQLRGPPAKEIDGSMGFKRIGN